MERFIKTSLGCRMPVVPPPNSNGIVRSLGFAFNFSNAFTTTAQQQGIPVNTSFSNLQASLGANTDLYPTQQTAWGRANQGVVAITTLTTPNALGEVGTINDIEATNTSLWAYAKQTYLDAAAAATMANLAFDGQAIANSNVGTSNDLYPTQQTAWGRANQAYAQGGGSLPAGGAYGEWLSYNGSNWVSGGSGGVVNLGFFAGETSQAEQAVAIGENAGRTNQGNSTAFPAIAVGWNAGRTNQGGNSIAIGEAAGQTNQGDNCIAIGTGAGVDNQPANTIILNASGAAFNAAQAGGMYVNPIRNVNGNPNWLTYNSMSGEITFDTLLATSLGSSNDTASLTTSVWAYAKQAESVANSNLSTLNTQFTPSGVGAVGTSADAQANNTSLWAYSKQALDDALLGQTAANSALGIVGTSGDTPSLLTTCFAYAKQAEIDAQTGITNALKAYAYNLTGTTINAIITNRGTGIINAFPATTFTLATSITFNIPPNWGATNNVYIDGWVLYNFQASINTFWEARYITNTYATPTDILGSTSVVADALSFPTSAQVYIPVNLVIPPTHLTAGGTITLSFYGSITTGSNYFAAAPVVAGRVGLALD